MASARHVRILPSSLSPERSSVYGPLRLEAGPIVTLEFGAPFVVAKVRVDDYVATVTLRPSEAIALGLRLRQVATEVAGEADARSRAVSGKRSRRNPLVELPSRGGAGNEEEPA